MNANELKIMPIKQVSPNDNWQCAKCNWIGKHKDSADKTPVVEGLWLLVCPECGNNSDFFKLDN